MMLGVSHLQQIFNFVQIEEESLPQAWGRPRQLLNALPDHPLKTNEILDIFYNGLTNASRDYLDSCAGCVFRERTVKQAEELLNNILRNDNEWTLPKPPPKPTPKKRGILHLSPEDMQEAKKSMKEKGIKAEYIKNLPPIKEIHGLDKPTQVVEVNSLLRFDKGDIPYNKSPEQCLNEFDNYIIKQEHFNANVTKQLKRNSIMIDRLSDLLFRIANDVKCVSKHASMVQTQLEQVAKSQSELLDEMNKNMHDHDVRVMTRGGRMTQDPLYPEGHPKRIEQDSQRSNVDALSPSRKKKEKEK
jgi:hypothetical protein